MKIKLLSLEMKNFKGVKDQLIKFGDTTQIQGDNGTGKSSIFDGFCWLLFGKNSEDKKVFEVQPLDENNNIIHHVDTIVTGVLEIDGVTKTFKRILKEKWQKQRGQAEQSLNGTQTDYEIDDIPVKQKEYLEKISDILDENMFKLLTNPLYFPGMEWKKQREILLDIIGDLDESSVINYNSKLKPLLKLLDGTNIDDFNKRTAASIKKLKDKVKDIPARIDENNSNICNDDFAALEKEKLDIQKQIDTIDSQITDSSKANEGKLKLQDDLFKLKNQLSTLQNEALKNVNKPLEEIQEKINIIKAELQKVEFKITTNNSSINNTTKYMNSCKEDLENTKNRKQELLDDYHKEKDIPFTFDDSLLNCPTCGREYDVEKIQEVKTDAEAKFNAAKKKTLSYIISKGKPLAEDIEKLESKIFNCEEDLKQLNDEILDIEGKKFVFEQNLQELEYQKQKINCIEPVIEGEKELIIKIEAIEGQISNFKSNNNSLLLEEKKGLQSQLSTIERTLGKQETNIDLQKRISELMQEEKDLNIQIANLEGEQFLGEEFIRTKVELLEATINKKFKGEVSFKLFKNLNNGGLEERCEALINGVPFTDANTASKINSGISILNTLCEHYKVNAPVFIDNAESVNEIKETESQLVLLKVSQDKKMKVEVK